MLDNVCLTDIKLSQTFCHYPFQWYYERPVGSNHLLITVGDSWTWGDSLGNTDTDHDDFVFRTSHLFGAQLATSLQADFINVAFPGSANISLFETTCTQVLNRLTKDYCKITVIFVLTETGRELHDRFESFQQHYTDNLRGKDWPTFDQLLHDDYDPVALDFCLMEMEQKGNYFRHQLLLYQHIKQAQNLEELLQNYESYIFKCLVKYMTKEQQRLPIRYLVSRNFTSTFDQNIALLPHNCYVNNRWVDVIAQRGCLDPYPAAVGVVSQIGMKPLLDFVADMTLLDAKAKLIELFDKANAAIDWLERSPYNNKRGTRHPNEIGHKWWADYLYDHCICKDQY